MDFHAIMNTEPYSFLHTPPRLGCRILLLGLGGSHAYGTNTAYSDIDFRGITLNLPPDRKRVECPVKTMPDDRNPNWEKRNP